MLLSRHARVSECDRFVCCPCLANLNHFVQLCSTDSSIIHIKTKDFHQDISEDVEIRFGTWNLKKKDKLKKGY